MHSSVAKLYEVFKPYRLGDDFTGCQHCVSVEDSAKLASKPMQELSVDDLNRFAFKSMSTWGAERHFKHFLPRLFELLLSEYSNFNFPEVLIGKLRYAKWDDWPDNERNAVTNFLQYLWSYHLAIPPEFDGDDRVATLLNALSETTNSFHPYFELFLAQDSSAPAHHIREMISNFADNIMTGTRYDFNLTRSDEFMAWLVSDDVICYLRRYDSDMLARSPYLFNQLDGMRSALATRN